MDRQREAATGGDVIYVDFVARTASREPLPASRISSAEWAAGAARCEALADQSEPKVAESLRRVARAYRAKAGGAPADQGYKPAGSGRAGASTLRPDLNV